ncbi:MAG TPA: hypothetical protein VGP24_04665 [Glaciihabitans sp.]|jgi:hypothetical protein|nr:hypothetical protein [Glaciihabitans sp.]
MLDTEDNQLLEVPGYTLSEETTQLFEAAIDEVPALQRQWDEEPITTIAEDDDILPESAKAKAMIAELLEYVLISRVSVHLSDHFRAGPWSDKQLKRYSRADIPHIVLANRFLELFSRDIRDRSGFSKEHLRDSDELWGAFSDTRQYRRFGLTLPTGSSFSLPESGRGFRVSTPAVNVKMAAGFEGIAGSVPYSFSRHYLKRDSFYVDAFEASFDISVQVKRRLLLKRGAVRKNVWAEELLDAIEADLSGDDFLERIQWNAVETAIRVFGK